MIRQKTMLLSAAALLVFLSGCANVPGPMALAVHEPGFDASKLATQRTIAPACPTPSSAAKLRAIEAEIEAAIRAGAAPDALATEWERLDEAARICRGRK